MARAPGSVRDAILEFMGKGTKEATLEEIKSAVNEKLGDVSSSSVRSYLNLNVPKTFERIGRGQYRLKKTVI